MRTRESGVVATEGGEWLHLHPGLALRLKIGVSLHYNDAAQTTCQMFPGIIQIFLRVIGSNIPQDYIHEKVVKRCTCTARKGPPSSAESAASPPTAPPTRHTASNRVPATLNCCSYPLAES